MCRRVSYDILEHLAFLPELTTTFCSSIPPQKKVGGAFPVTKWYKKRRLESWNGSCCLARSRSLMPHFISSWECPHTVVDSSLDLCDLGWTSQKVFQSRNSVVRERVLAKSRVVDECRRTLAGRISPPLVPWRRSLPRVYQVQMTASTRSLDPPGCQHCRPHQSPREEQWWHWIWQPFGRNPSLLAKIVDRLPLGHDRLHERLQESAALVVWSSWGDKSCVGSPRRLQILDRVETCFLHHLIRRMVHHHVYSGRCLWKWLDALTLLGRYFVLE